MNKNFPTSNKLHKLVYRNTQNYTTIVLKTYNKSKKKYKKI